MGTTVRFKKDYMAYMAICLFILIVAAEIVMAVWLPMHLKSQDAWAIQESRQEMIDLFDSLRNNYKKIKPTNQRHSEEVALVMDCLDDNAIYLRTYNKDLSMDQIKALDDSFKTIFSFYQIHKAGKPIGVKRTLDPEQFIRNLDETARKSLIQQQKEYSKTGF